MGLHRGRVKCSAAEGFRTAHYDSRGARQRGARQQRRPAEIACDVLAAPVQGRIGMIAIADCQPAAHKFTLDSYVGLVCMQGWGKVSVGIASCCVVARAGGGIAQLFAPPPTRARVQHNIICLGGAGLFRHEFVTPSRRGCLERVVARALLLCERSTRSRCACHARYIENRDKRGARPDADASQGGGSMSRRSVAEGW